MKTVNGPAHWLAALCVAAISQMAVLAQDVAPHAATQVVPINWSALKRYDQIRPRPQELEGCARILLNSARYNLAWATNAISKLDGRMPLAGKEGVSGRGAHDFIRPICNAAFGLAVMLKSGLFDAQELGCPAEEVQARAVQLIAGAASHHRGQSWGYPWQSALWAAYLGHASWLLWEELDAAQRALVAGIVEKEADRFLNYVVPYWNGKGGDTKAEENAWNSMVLSLAVAMMPRHPHAAAWREKCSELMISAYATQADMQSERIVDGRPLKHWLRGFNANPDGSVVNHGFLHPDYILCVHLNLRAFVVQPLAGQAVPEAAKFNADLVYRCLVTRQWPSPPYAAPGGTIYRPGEPFLYYPEKADWGRVHCETAYLVDAHAHVLGLDKELPHRAQDWLRVRARKIFEMQSRHADRRVWASGEFDTWPGREQTAFGRLAAAFLALWLDVQRFPVRSANWLAIP